MKNKYLIIQIICLILTVAIGIFNIGYSRNVAERERQLGDAYNSIQFALAEISVVQQDIDNHMIYLDHIYSTAEDYGVPPEVILAIMKVESNFNPEAQNGRCYGLTQIHDVHCEPFGVTTEDLLDLRRNTVIGTTRLSALINQSDSLTEALGKYNMGEAGYAAYCEEVGTETTAYSEKVYQIIDGFRN